MENWRPGRKVRSNQTGFWGAVSFPSVSIKDRSLLVPLVILNVCLTFSWPNKVPFDCEASDMIRARIYMGARTGTEGSMTGTRRVSPRCILVVGRSLGTAAPVYPATFTGIVSLVICRSLDRWVWFVWGINHQLVRNRFESPSLLDSEHLTRATAS
jgi:hypothetical protein